MYWKANYDVQSNLASIWSIRRSRDKWSKVLHLNPRMWLLYIEISACGSPTPRLRLLFTITTHLVTLLIYCFVDNAFLGHCSSIVLDFALSAVFKRGARRSVVGGDVHEIAVLLP